MLVSRVEPRRRRLFMKPTDRYKPQTLTSDFCRLQILNVSPRPHWPKTRCSPAPPESQVRHRQAGNIVTWFFCKQHVELRWFHIFQYIECSSSMFHNADQHQTLSTLLFPSHSVCHCGATDVTIVAHIFEIIKLDYYYYYYLLFNYLGNNEMNDLIVIEALRLTQVALVYSYCDMKFKPVWAHDCCLCHSLNVDLPTAEELMRTIGPEQDQMRGFSLQPVRSGLLLLLGFLGAEFCEKWYVNLCNEWIYKLNLSCIEKENGGYNDAGAQSALKTNIYI